jgi:FixJ family two-component response regulator
MNGQHITIVDDDEAVRLSLQALLEAAGFEVDIFETGEAFLAADGRPACVIVDFHLPGLDGIETMRRLHDHGQPAPVILVSAQLEPGTRSRAAGAGAVAVLQKPLQEGMLLECIGRALAPAQGCGARTA